DIRAEEIASASVEAERPPAEVRVRDQEPLLSRLEEGVVEGERQGAQDRRDDEDFDERPHRAAEREADPTPRGTAQSISPSSDHGDRDEEEDEQRRERLGRDVNRFVSG